MPEREFIADACSKHNSRSSPALVTIWGSIDMLIGSRKLWLADHSYSYLALEQFNRRLNAFVCEQLAGWNCCLNQH